MTIVITMVLVPVMKNKPSSRFLPWILILLCLSAAPLSARPEWSAVDTLKPAFSSEGPRPPFTAVFHDEGIYYLLAGGTHYHSGDGVEWVDGLPENPSSEIPWLDPLTQTDLPLEGAGVLARLTTEGSAVGYASFGSWRLAVSRDGESWSYLSTNLPTENSTELADYINGHWVAVKPRLSETGNRDLDLYISADGIHWEVADWPRLQEDGVAYHAFYGAGAVLIIADAPTGRKAISTTDLESWKVVEMIDASPDPICLNRYSRNRMGKDGDTYLLQSSCILSSPPRQSPVLQLSPVLTNDFETFRRGSDPDPAEVYPQSATNGSSQVQITTHDGETVLETTTADDVLHRFSVPEIDGVYIVSVATVGGIRFIATPGVIYRSLTPNEPWERSLEWDSHIRTPSHYTGFQYFYSGFRDLTAWKDEQLWVISNARNLSTGEFLPAGVWRYEIAEDEWIMERSLSGEECQQLFVADDRLCLAGIRNGSAFVDTTTDGSTWETHEIGMDLHDFRIQYVEGKFWLTALKYAYPDEHYQITDAWLYHSTDLENWQEVLYSDSFAFRDVAYAGGQFFVSSGSFFEPGTTRRPPAEISEVWTSPDGSNWTWVNLENTKISGLFTETPEGGLLDLTGMYSADGLEWEPLTGYSAPDFARIIPVAGGFPESEGYFLVGHHLKYQYAAGGYGIVNGSTVVDNEVGWYQIAESGEAGPNGDWFSHVALGLLYWPYQPDGSRWLWSEDLGWIWISSVNDGRVYLHSHDRNAWILVDTSRAGWYRELDSAQWEALPWNDSWSLHLPVASGILALRIPAGEFLMGAQLYDWQAHPDERPIHWEVIEEDFWFGATEVTQASFEAVMGYNPVTGALRGARKPAVQVTRAEALEFCRKLTGLGHADGWLATSQVVTLPTEAQWEYAASQRVAWESTSPYTRNIEWRFLYQHANAGSFDPGRTEVWDYPSPGTLWPVGQYPPISAEFPVFDAMGNVWEWCLNDYYLYDSGGNYPAGAHQAAANAYHTARGGGWRSPDGDLRTCNRTALEPGFKSDDTGFRIVIVPAASL